MPRMTVKYRNALNVARREGIPSDDDQETLYAALQEKGWFWDSRAQTWEAHDIEDADDPTPLIHVRVWSSGDMVEAYADDVIKKHPHWELVERSTPYPCRPPKQREARIYLKFLPERRNRNHA